MHHITEHTQQPLASTWLGDHQGRPSAPQIRPSKRLPWSVNKELRLRLRYNTLTFANMRHMHVDYPIKNTDVLNLNVYYAVQVNN